MPNPRRHVVPNAVLTRCNEAAPVQLLLTAFVWVAHFFHANRFGVYEDDWNRIPYTAGISWHELLELLRHAFTGDLSQGRPFHPGLIYLFSFVGFHTGSLLGLYAIGLAIEIVNTLLFHALLMRVFKDRGFALLGALAFCVFPADTTQPFLTHAFGVQTALCMLLVALNLYVAGCRVFAYLAIALMLFTYETPYLVFATAPLLKPHTRRECWTHWTVMGALLMSGFLFRRLTGEVRVSHLPAWELLTGCSNIVTGPLTCVLMYVYRPFEALLKLRGLDRILTVIAILVCRWLTSAKLAKDSTGPNTASGFPQEAVNPPNPVRLGVLMLLLAYPLTLTTSGISVSGRGTRVHIAAALGSSILVAWVCQRLLTHTESRPGIVLRRWGVAVLFGLLTGFGLVVQRDYALSWQDQRSFWTGLVSLAPPLQDGQVIFVEPGGLYDTRQLLFLRKDLTGIPGTRQIRSLDNLLTGLQALYQVPPTWKRPPQVFRLPLNWRRELFTGDDRLRLLTIEAPFAFDSASRAPIMPGQAIFIQTSQGQLSRADTLVNPLDGHILPLNTAPGPVSNLQKSAFFPYIIYPADKPAGPYMVLRQ